MSNIDHQSSSSSHEIQRNEQILLNEPSSNMARHGEFVESTDSSRATHRPAASTTNDEIETYTNDISNTEQGPPISYRVSPYDTIVSENLLGDDRTIDAAVVEEIIDDHNHVTIPASHEHSSPASSSHRRIDINNGRNNNVAANFSAEAQLIPVVVSNQNIIPEVEPEVDIEEVRVEHDRNNMSTISALTTNTTSIDQQDTKQPPSSSTPRVAAAVVNDETQRRQPSLPYPPINPNFTVSAAAAFAALPPPMPQRRALVSDYRGYSAGTASTSPASVPMFKSTMMSIPRHSSSDHTRTSASNDSRQQLQDELPDYKDQVRPMMPNRTAMNSRNASNNSGGSDNNTPNSNTNPQNDSGGSNRYSSGQNSQGQHSDDEHIPVVAAILVPAERLAAEERLEEQWLQQQQEHRYNNENGLDQPRRQMNQQSDSNLSSGESTLTTSHTSSNHNIGNNDRTPQNNESHRENSTQRTKSSENLNSGPSPMSERRFWMTIILTALLLNSLLVAGAVVGGFCAAGKCSSVSINENVSMTPPASNNVTDDNNIISTNVPSPSPSDGRLLSLIPTVDSSGATMEVFPTPSDSGVIISPSSPTIRGTVLPTFSSSNTPFGISTATVSPSTNDTSFVDNVPESGSGNNTTPSDDDFVFDGTEAPTGEFTTKTNGTNGKTDIVVSFPTSSPTTINTTSDYPGPVVPTSDDISSSSDTGIRFAILLPLIGIVELLIVLVLVCYYRHWKRQRQKQLCYSNCDDTAPTSPATSKSVSLPGQQPQQVSPAAVGHTNSGGNTTGGCADSRDCGSSHNPLPTIAETTIFEV